MGRMASLAAVAALALVAASCLPRTRPATDLPVDETWVYSCPGNYQFSARVMNEVVSLRLPTRTTAIPRAGASTGTRYSTSGMELTRSAEGATLRIDGATHADCTGQRAATAWDEARLLGADFRAIGNEPAWSLEVDDGRTLRFLIEGSSEIHAPISEPVRTGATTSYRATSEGHTIEVTIDAQPCANPRLGEGLTHIITLAVDGFPYAGCGRMLGG